MKKISLYTAVMLIMVFTSCKTTRQTAQSPYTADPAVQPKVFSVPSGAATETTKKEEPKDVEESPIAVRKEQVSFTQQEDRTKNENNTFFVIIGSFSQLENAKNYREALLNEGFTPIILHSETGYYRICVNSYVNELEARARISNIRQAFPKYSDVWLLIRQ